MVSVALPVGVALSVGMAVPVAVAFPLAVAGLMALLVFVMGRRCRNGRGFDWFLDGRARRSGRGFYRIIRGRRYRGGLVDRWHGHLVGEHVSHHMRWLRPHPRRSRMHGVWLDTSGHQ